MKYCIGLGFTNKCNMNCPFCYSKEKRQEITEAGLPLWKDFTRNNHNMIDSINYGTGENTLSNEWYNFIDFVHSEFPEIKQALTTNGTLICSMREDAKKAEIIKRCISEIDVSIDYGEKNKHNYYRGNKQAFGWAIDTLAWCNNYKIAPTVVVLGTDDTLQAQNMESIFTIAKKYDAKVRVNLYRPVNKKSSVVPPSLDTILRYFDWANENHQIASLSDPLFSALLTQGESRVDPSGCSSLRITHDGNIYPSTYLMFEEFLIGNIKDFRIDESVAENTVLKRITTLKIPQECSQCKYKDTCRGGAIDRRYLWYRSLDKKDPYCFVEKKELQRNYVMNKDGFSSVHDNYLPTLFFLP